MTRRIPAATLIAAIVAVSSWLAAAPAEASDCSIRTLGSSQDGETLSLAIEVHESCEPVLEASVDGVRTEFDLLRTASAQNRIVIAVDNSTSLASGDHDLVVHAVRGLVRKLDDSTELALVSYGSGARLEVAATRDHLAVIDRLDDLEAAGGAALFSGVAEAARAAGDSPGSALILLFTYGWDWGALSADSAEMSLQAVQLSGASVYVQSLVPSDDDVPFLSRLATDGVIRRGWDLPQLDQALNLLVSSEPRQYQLTIDVSQLLVGQHTVELSDRGGAGTLVNFSIDRLPPAVTPGESLPWWETASATGITGTKESAAVAEEPELQPASTVTTAMPSATAQTTPPPTSAAPAAHADPTHELEQVLIPLFALLVVIFARQRFRLGRERAEDETMARARRVRHQQWLLAN